MKMEGFNVCGGITTLLTSNRTQWALAPNFFSQATRKSPFFFFTESICWAPWISQIQSTGLSSIFVRVQS